MFKVKNRKILGIIFMLFIVLTLLFLIFKNFLFATFLMTKLVYFDIPSDMSSFSLNNNIYENNKFICSFISDITVDTGGDGGRISLRGGSPSPQCITKQNFYQQEIWLSGWAMNVEVDGQRILQFSGDQSNIITYHLIPSILNPNLYYIDVAGSIVSQFTIPNPPNFYLTFTANYRDQKNDLLGDLYKIEYQPLFSCDLSNNEVWITESFTSDFSYSDLYFSPTRFCNKERPATIRDINLGESADTLGEIYQKLSTNQLVSVPSNANLITVHYATIFVAGVNNVCGVNQANVRINNTWVCKDVIKPVVIAVQCNQNSDCPIPLASTCPNYFIGCLNNVCMYDNTVLNSVQCQNQVVTIVTQTQIIKTRTVVTPTALNTFVFTQNANRQTLNIGNKVFSSAISNFVCNEQGSISPPNPNSNCWETIITYDNQNYKLLDSNIISLNPYIDVQYFAGGTIYNGVYANPTDWSNSFIFTINNDKAFNIDVEDTSSVLLNSNKNINLIVNNNLPDGNIIISYNQISKINNNVIQNKVIKQSIKNGLNNITVSLDTTTLGINQLTIQTYYLITADKNVQIPSSQFIVNYNVVTELPKVTEFVTVEKEKIVTKEVLKEIKIDSKKQKIILYIIIIVLILVIIFAFTKRKK